MVNLTLDWFVILLSKTNKMKIFSIWLICINPILLTGQDQCIGSFTEYILNSNHIRASFFPRGNKFTSGSVGKFLVPYPASDKLSTIFASTPWLGAFDEAGNIKIAAETYSRPDKTDFSIGPLSSVGTNIDSICERFDHVWSVFREDIMRHRIDFEIDGIIQDTIESVFGWPARRNKFFSQFNDFELPDYNEGWADFMDLNSNNEYEPELGEYPIVRLSGKKYIPDQILWMVFNDVGSVGVPGSGPLRFEIRLTAFAFHCQDNELLNNTIFNTYKIINRSVTEKDSVFFGMWTDYDLGCYSDDLIGCDSSRSTKFVYNYDILDGDVNNSCANGAATYSEVPPVQSMTYLNYPMNSFISYSTEVDLPIEFYRLLNGDWSNGSHIRPEGHGDNTSSGLAPTKFLFHGDSRDTSA